MTIFGQSGGGGKVSTLLAMPSAKGLFHKAIVESGSTLKQVPLDEAQKTTRNVMAQLGLGPTQIGELQQLPIQKLLAAMGAAAAPGAGAAIGSRRSWTGIRSRAILSIRPRPMCRPTCR